MPINAGWPAIEGISRKFPSDGYYLKIDKKNFYFLFVVFKTKN